MNTRTIRGHPSKSGLKSQAIPATLIPSFVWLDKIQSKDHVLLHCHQRLLAATLAVVLLGLLTFARILEPCPEGFGTHRQSGWPPCTFVMLLGIRCPTCGMTTSWAHFVRGQIVEAIKVNSVGAILCVTSIVHVPWLFICAATGRWVGWKPNASTVANATVAIVVVAIIQWAYRLL